RMAGMHPHRAVERHQPVDRPPHVGEAGRPSADGAPERPLEQHVRGEDVRARDQEGQVVEAVARREQRLDLEPAGPQRLLIPQLRPAQQGHAVALGRLLDADDVVGVAVRHQDVRDGDAVVADTLLERLDDAVAVDEDAAPARPLRDQIGVRRPLRVLGALDDHASNLITLRMPSCASISSNPRFTSSSVMWWEMNGSTSMSPASHRSTSRGTPSRPFTPPKLLPAMRRPVMRNRGITFSVSPLPATPATVHRPQPILADSTACRMTCTLPVAPNV